MKPRYLESLSLIHTAYNLFRGNISLYDFTFYNLSVIYLRKNNLIEYVDGRAIYKEDIVKAFLPQEIFKKFESFNINNRFSVALEEKYTIFFIIEESVFNKYYKELAELCLQLLLKGKENKGYLEGNINPKELTELINYFLPENKNLSVYNPFSGLSPLGLKLKNEVEYFAEEVNKELVVLANLIFLIHNKTNYNIKVNDSVISIMQDEKKYDLITFNLPVRFLSSSEYVNFGNLSHKVMWGALITKITATNIKNNGRAVFVVPDSFLFTRSKQVKNLRKFLVNHNALTTIIKLPLRLTGLSSVPLNIVVIKNIKEKKGKIKLLDASEMILEQNGRLNVLDVNRVIKVLNSNSSIDIRFVKPEEVIKNNYNLSIIRYFIEDLGLSEIDSEKLVKLEELITVVKRKKNFKKEGKCIKIGDLSNDKIQYNKNFKDVEIKKLRRDSNLLNNDSLLLSTMFEDLKPTLFNKTEEEIYYPFYDILACIVDAGKVDLDYLVVELNKEYIKKQLNSKRNGTVIQRISRKDLLEILIVLPSIQEQLKKVHRFKQSIIEKKQQDFDKLVKDSGIEIADENSFLRHQIAGTLKNARGSFRAIKQIINEQIVSDLPGVLKLKRNPKFNKTLLDYLNILERDINSINKTVSIVGEELDLTQVKVGEFNMVSFLTNYVEEVKNRDSNLFEIFLNIDEACFLKESQFKGIIINGDKELLRRIFDNIINNAVNHGFNNTISPLNFIEVNVLCDFKNLNIQVDFGNTGQPIPENFSQEAFIRKGSKAGVNSGDGVGGWFINEVMKLHKGTLGFSDKQVTGLVDREIVTTIELKFPIGLSL